MDRSTGSAYSSHRRWLLFVSLSLLLLPVLISIVPFLSSQGIDITQSGDNALLEMATGDVTGGVYTGAYSRFGFHHPGPLYFYLRYPLYAVSGGSAASFYVVSALIAGLSLWGSFLIIRKTTSLTSAILFAAVISFYMFRLTSSIWFSQWNPFIVIFPVCLSVIAVAASASGVTRYFPVAVISLSFAAQTHLGVLPSIGLLALYGIFMNFHQKKFLNRFFVVSMILAFVLWIPAIVDQVSPAGTGNTSLIANFLGESSPAGITRVSIASWSSAVVPIELAFLDSWIRKSSLSLVWAQFAVAVGRSLLLFAAWLVARRRKKEGFETRLCEVTILLIFASLMSVFSFRGEIHQYLTVWISVISPLSWFALLLVFSGIEFPGRRRILPVVFFSSLLFFAVLNARSEIRNGFSTDPLHYHDTTVESLSQRIVEEITLLHSNQIQISIEIDTLWPEMAGLACKLRKLGYEVAIQQDFSFMLNVPNPVFAQPHEIVLYMDRGEADFYLSD